MSDKSTPNIILEKFSKLNRPLVLDGAMGTYLIEKGIKPYREMWVTLSNIDFPEIVKSVHKDYIFAGAEIITTNTFNSNPVSLELSHYIEKSSEELVQTAVTLAKQAREETDSDVIIAGCNAPAEDCYQHERTISKQKLEYNHHKHIELLWAAGVDIIWNETHGHWDEIEIVCEFCENNSLPYAINLYFEENMKILSGENLDEIVKRIIENYPNALIGFNCIAPSHFTEFIENNFVQKEWGFYLNCGEEGKHEGEIFCAISPDVYIEYVKKIINRNTAFIGSCCGSNPQHTKQIKEFLIAENYS